MECRGFACLAACGDKADAHEVADLLGIAHVDERRAAQVAAGGLQRELERLADRVLAERQAGRRVRLACSPCQFV